MAVDLEQVMDVVDVMDLLLVLTLYMLESRVDTVALIVNRG
jgi:hypothetical protein